MYTPTMELESSNFYNGNPMLKKAGVNIPITPEQAKEIYKCKKDAFYFIETYCKISDLDHGVVNFKLFPFQKRALKKIYKNRFVLMRWARQMGKTTSVAAILLWYAIFNGEDKFEIAIVANKREQAREILSRMQMMYEYLPLWLQPGVRTWNKGDVALGNGCKVFTAATKGSGIRGRSVNILYCVAGETMVTYIDDDDRLYHCSIEKAHKRELHRKTAARHGTGARAKMKILSSDGWKEFGGFVDNGIRVVGDVDLQGTTITVTPEHRFIIDGKEVRADKFSMKNLREERVYDAIDVDGHEYLTNGIPSHNCDEFAFVENDVEFYTATYPVVSSGTTTKLIASSTPNGMNQFYKLYKEASEGRNKYVIDDAIWSDHPRRGKKWKEEQMANMTERQFNQEFLTTFYGSSDTLISGDKLQVLTFDEPIRHITLSHTNDLEIFEDPLEGHSYVVTVDVSEGIGKDYSVATVFDVTSTPYHQVAVYRNNVIIPLALADVVNSIGRYYNEAVVIVETNSVGRQTTDSLWYDYEYENMLISQTSQSENVIVSGGPRAEIGMRTTKKTKMLGCSALKALIESDQLIVHDFETVQELTTFISKNNSFEAEKGKTDDIVMSLVIFAWFTTQNYFADMTDVNVRALVRDNLNKQDDAAPIGFHDDGTESVDSDFPFF